MEAKEQTTWLLKAGLIAGLCLIGVIFFGVWRLLNVTAGGGAIALQTPVAAASAQPLASQPAATPSPTATPSGITAVANAFPNVHSGVGLTSPIIGTLARGDRVQVVGRSSDNAWLEIRFSQSSNGLGWVSADLVSVSPAGSAIPVATPP